MHPHLNPYHESNVINLRHERRARYLRRIFFRKFGEACGTLRTVFAVAGYAFVILAVPSAVLLFISVHLGDLADYTYNKGK